VTTRKPFTDTAFDILVVVGLLTLSALLVCLIIVVAYGTLVVIGVRG
jgi:hypothetical protein